MKIGPYQIPNPVIAAPMAGITDKPYRKVCRAYGAGLVISEMVTSRADLRHTTKTRLRSDHNGEPEPVVVQIVGTEPAKLAEAAQYNVANGAQIIDINMGCPAKKVCNKLAGSALLSNEMLVNDILNNVVNAVSVPVTVKIRTGITPETKNAVTIAKIAEQAGIQSITIHGRTRQCKFKGTAEYDTIAQIKQQVSIPVVANGDIDSPEAAQKVLNYTKADAVMVGRATQGRPWLLRQIADYLTTGEYHAEPSLHEKTHSIMQHLQDIHQFYGDFMGVRFARKHIKWYLQHWPINMPNSLKQKINETECSQTQHQLMRHFLLNSTIKLAA